MHPVIGVVIPAAVIAAVVMLLFMVKPQLSSRILLCCIVVCAVLGLVIYGVGYALLEDSVLSAVFKTFFSLCRIFIGDSDYGEIEAAPGFDAPWLITLLYLVQAVGLFSTLGAAISALGAADSSCRGCRRFMLKQPVLKRSDFTLLSQTPGISSMRCVISSVLS